MGALTPAAALPKLPPIHRCDECGAPFYQLRHDQVFHRQSCRRAFHRRKEVRGAKLLSFALEWRRTRRRGGFSELTQMIDEFLREDRQRAERVKRST